MALGFLRKLRDGVKSGVSRVAGVCQTILKNQDKIASGARTAMNAIDKLKPLLK